MAASPASLASPSGRHDKQHQPAYCQYAPSVDIGAPSGSNDDNTSQSSSATATTLSTQNTHSTQSTQESASSLSQTGQTSSEIKSAKAATVSVSAAATTPFSAPPRPSTPQPGILLHPTDTSITTPPPTNTGSSLAAGAIRTITSPSAPSSPSTSSWAASNTSPVHGSKRTASGTIKQSSNTATAPTTTATSPVDPVFASQPFGSIDDSNSGRTPKGYHSRNISLDSNVSVISDLSSQLRTRLSYALVKVQNGWEQRSIDEVETLASQHQQRRHPSHYPPDHQYYHSRHQNLANSPPTSADSHYASPVAAPPWPTLIAANASRRSRDLSHALNSQVYAPPLSAPLPAAEGVLGSRTNDTSGSHYYTWSTNARPTGAMPPSVQSLIDPTSRTSQQSSHSTRNVIPKLAPAPELVPGNPPFSRRDQTTIVTNGLTGLRSRTHTMTPTPQEQDAVDSLLYMSSPANSTAYTPYLDRSQSQHRYSNYSSQRRHQHQQSWHGFRSMPSTQQSSPTRGLGKAGVVPRLPNGASSTSAESFALPTSPRQLLPFQDNQQSLYEHQQPYAHSKRHSVSGAGGTGDRITTDQDVEKLLDSIRHRTASEEEDEWLGSMKAVGEARRDVRFEAEQLQQRTPVKRRLSTHRHHGPLSSPAGVEAHA